MLVPRGGATALVRLVGELLDAPHRLMDVGRACQEWVVSRFSEEAVAERVRRVYADFEVVG